MPLFAPESVRNTPESHAGKADRKQRFGSLDSAPWIGRFMEVGLTETSALTPALSPRRGRKMRRDEASSDHGFSTVSGMLRL